MHGHMNVKKQFIVVLDWKHTPRVYIYYCFLNKVTLFSLLSTKMFSQSRSINMLFTFFLRPIKFDYRNLMLFWPCIMNWSYKIPTWCT